MANVGDKVLQMRQNDAQHQVQQQQPTVSIPRPALHPTLVPELLGFSPQMLLDDIISIASDAIVQCQQAMEPFMQRWANNRLPPPPDTSKPKGKGKGKSKARQSEPQTAEDAKWDGLEAVEQGLVAFSTLLENHTDIAFDFFEAWSLRNVFALPPDLKIVAPHQKGLDLDVRPEEEMELMADIEDLRRKIENQRRLKRTYTKALRISRIGLLKSQRRLSRLDYYSRSGPNLAQLHAIPDIITELFESAAALPHIDSSSLGGTGSGGSSGSASLGRPLADPGKRLWEMGETGYTTWAVQQLLLRMRENEARQREEQGENADGAEGQGGSTTVSAVWSAAERAGKIGEMEEMKRLAADLEGENSRSGNGRGEDDMDTT